PRLLEYTWGGDTLRFELQPDGDGTVLTFTDTFNEYGKAARDGAGWHLCLEHLEHALDGTPPPGPPQERWSELHPGYVERFPPEASALGVPDGM
ncbi:MAG: SRPBCC domain-containing protein, partial [Solirubrobacteraceae bacterium]